MRKNFWLPLIAGAAVLTVPPGIWAQTGSTAAAPAKQSSAKPATSTSSTAKPATAAATPTYNKSLLKPALLKEQAPATYQAKFTTTRGDFTITVHRDWAPLGADRFYNLVKHGFYDNMYLFRAVPGFVVQFGISSYPQVSAAWRNTNIKDDPVTQSNKRGYVTFATAGPNTRTTQVFISFKDNSALDHQGFAPFGVIDAEGMKVVEMFYDQYGDQPTGQQDQIEKQGKAFLTKNYPKLDMIKSAVIVGTAAAAPAAKPAAKPAPATTTKPAPKPVAKPQ